MLATYEPIAMSAAGYAFAILMGLLWGSFANVCIYRWPPTDEFPDGRSVVKPGSHCFVCKKPIAWYDNVPLLSYLWLRGKCRNCKTGFSSRYLFVEALTGALFALCWWSTMHGNALWEPFDLRLERFVIDAAFCLVLVIVTFIDLDHKLILNILMYPAIVVFYAATFLLPERHWWDGLIGLAIGYGLPWLIGEIYFRLRGVEGLGLGDAVLLGLFGAFFGWKGVLVSLFGGALIGTAMAIPMIITKGRTAMREIEVPFGPYLCAAALFYLLAEPWMQLSFRVFD